MVTDILAIYYRNTNTKKWKNKDKKYYFETLWKNKQITEKADEEEKSQLIHVYLSKTKKKKHKKLKGALLLKKKRRTHIKKWDHSKEKRKKQ